MSITLDGTNGITTPDLESSGPVTGTTGTFSGAVSGTTGTFSGLIQAAAAGVRFDDTTVQTTAATAPTTATVLTAIAGASAGAVGTYMICFHTTVNGSLTVGQTHAGSLLKAYGAATWVASGACCVGYSGFVNAALGPAQAGTWRSVSSSTRTENGQYVLGLFFRIS